MWAAGRLSLAAFSSLDSGLTEECFLAPSQFCTLDQNQLVSSSGSPNAESASLRDLVEARCTALFTKCHSVWWLFNGHLQTAYAIVGDFTKVDQVWYQRRLLRLLDGGTLGLDFTPPVSSAAHEDTPIIVVQHGLTGGAYTLQTSFALFLYYLGSHEPYVRAILAPACTPVHQGGLGYRAVVVNFRGCSGVPLTSQKFYTAAQTDDLRQALIFVSKLYPKAPLLGLGFSIGANVMIRYLAEEGENSQLSSACVLGCPWDLQTNNERTLGKRLYLRAMGDNVMQLIRHHRHVLTLDPEHPVAKAVPGVLGLKKPTLTKFDDAFTRCVTNAPPFPFSSVDAYYSWASSHQFPCLTINSADDPVVRRVQTYSGRNGYIVAVLTATGGHLGWYTSGRKRWTTKPVLEWLQLVGKEVVRDPIETSLHTDESGYLRDSRWPELGCKEVAGGGLIDGNRPERELFQGL
ncbi:AB-hydrolase YheT [Mycena rebaudengoi]|nr:AB-hydrolase YheT [Mycena rebaudengoi]